MVTYFAILVLCSQQFCREVNARSKQVREGVPMQVSLVAYSDGDYKFWFSSPPSTWFLMRVGFWNHLQATVWQVARIPFGSGNTRNEIIGNMKTKEVYHIAKAKCMDPSFIGIDLERLCSNIIGSAKSMGIETSKELMDDFRARDEQPVGKLEAMRTQIKNKKR
eukprot:Filipodium_phascolosomae@DN1997_c0_g1_i1.p1